MTNGWGKMNSYAAQVSPADRWAIAAYIRTLQIAQDPDLNLKMANESNTASRPSASPRANTNGGVR